MFGFGKKQKQWTMTSSGITAIIFYVVCGLLLLILPDLTIHIVNYALAIALCIAGIAFVASYMRTNVLEGLMGLRLTAGLLLIFVGISLFFAPTFLLELLPFVWGLSLIGGGFAKVQIGVDLKRMNDPQWWMVLIGAGISIVLGAFAVIKPLFVVQVITQFVGISLLVEAGLDLLTLVVLKKKVKNYRHTIEI